MNWMNMKQLSTPPYLAVHAARGFANPLENLARLEKILIVSKRL
jgi:hypothetical protein